MIANSIKPYHSADETDERPQLPKVRCGSCGRYLAGDFWLRGGEADFRVPCPCGKDAQVSIDGTNIQVVTVDRKRPGRR